MGIAHHSDGPAEAIGKGGARSTRGGQCPPYGKLRAWLELSRISNLPTCFTNVLAGVAIGAGPGTLPWAHVALLAGAIGLLYVSGMALNDVVDAERDRGQRPDRPIPSGRISRAAALAYAVLAMLLGVAGIVLVAPAAAPWALGLAAAIVAYDLLHARFAASVVLMGACRGLVYPVAAVAALPDGVALDLIPVAAFGSAMTAYIVLLTIVARHEHPGAPHPPRLELALPLIALAPALLVRPAAPGVAIGAGVLLVAWLLRASAHVWMRPGRVGAAVMGWLAGICLVDAFFLALLDRPFAAAVAVACFLLTVLGHRRILGS